MTHEELAKAIEEVTELSKFDSDHTGSYCVVLIAAKEHLEHLQRPPFAGCEPEAIKNLRSKSVAIATNGSTIIPWPENNHILWYVECLQEEVEKLKRDLSTLQKPPLTGETPRTLCRQLERELMQVQKENEELKAELSTAIECHKEDHHALDEIGYALFKRSDFGFTDIVRGIDQLLSAYRDAVKAATPFGSGVDPISWGKIKAHLPTPLAKQLTHFQVELDKALSNPRAQKILEEMKNE